MIGVIFLILIYFLINQVIFKFYEKRHSFFSKQKMNLLYLYHLVFFGVYLWYAYNNPSDSKGYYAFLELYNGDWIGTFGTDKYFIHFLAYPFHSIGFSYEMLMITFAWLGFLGFMYAYLFFREKIPVKVEIFKMDFLTLILFFPNMHFWSASLGKGAPIFLGLMMFFYALLSPKKRILILVLGSLIIFQIRPHVFLFAGVGAVLGYMSGREKIPFSTKLFIYVSLISVLVLAQDKILAVVNLQGSENLVQDFQNFSEERADDLNDAGSGVDMSNYPLPFKLFTFWFRPLFVDAPNMLGLITSFENLLYLLIFLKIFRKDFIGFARKAPSYVKTSLVIFLLSSFAMTFVMSNLGIIMRQKQMVMYFLFFVIYYYLAQKKYNKIMDFRKRKKAEAKNKEKDRRLSAAVQNY